MAGERNTKQRQLILEILRSTDTHPTADWVFLKVRNKLPNVSLGTVYRNLGVLKEQEVIQELTQAGHQSRYDGNPVKHYHFCCLGCGQVRDIPLQYDEQLDKALEHSLPGFQIRGHATEFFGLCPECVERGD